MRILTHYYDGLAFALKSGKALVCFLGPLCFGILEESQRLGC